MRALVLSGGGSRGAYQVGVLKHLLGNLEIQYDIICGISVGAINALHLVAYSHGHEKECINTLSDMWNNLEQSDIYVSWKPFGRLHFLWKSSLYNSKPLRKFIEKHIQKDGIKNSGKKLRIGAVSLNTAQYRVFDENYEDLVSAVLASSSFPMSFLPEYLEEQYWTDGGVREIIPFWDAIDAGAIHVDVISNAPPDLPYSDKVLGLKLPYRILDIMSEDVSDNDLLLSQDYENVNVIRPTSELTDDSLDFSQENIQKMIKRGYEDAVSMYSI